MEPGDVWCSRTAGRHSSRRESRPCPATIPQFAKSDPYEVAVRSQAGARVILRKLDALDEIRDALLRHCEEYRVKRLIPLYKPELLKRQFDNNWIREPRVPPLDPKLDDVPMNERYDLLKFFPWRGGEVGVAIEMDNWMVHRDLLKFRRGLERGQIAVGVIIQPHYHATHYCFEHLRPLYEPLFGDIPVLYCCPRGPGLKEPLVKTTKPRPFLWPKKTVQPPSAKRFRTSGP